MDTTNNQSSFPQNGAPGQVPQNPNVPQFEQPREPRSSMPIVALVALVIVAIIAGLYLWGMSVSTRPAENANDQKAGASIVADADIDAIERDLNSTDVDGSDKELEAIEAEF